jgi:hypothetical protein
MRLHFDLESFEDVSDHADRILERLRRGSMPCDGAWPPQQVEVFDRWVRGKLLWSAVTISFKRMGIGSVVSRVVGRPWLCWQSC